MKHLRISLVLVLLACLASLLAAGDYQWVRRTYSWRSNGLMRTAAVPLFGDEAVIRCSSPVKGAVKVTLIDESAKPRAPKVLVSTQHLRSTDSTTVRNMEKLSLLIESQGECVVEIDQYLESVGEWRLRTWKQERTSLTPKKLAVWAGDAPMKFEYKPKQDACRVIFSQRGEGTAEVVATDPEGKALLRRYLHAQGSQALSWLHGDAAVTFSVQCPAGTAWMLEITEE